MKTEKESKFFISRWQSQGHRITSRLQFWFSNEYLICLVTLVYEYLVTHIWRTPLEASTLSLACQGIFLAAPREIWTNPFLIVTESKCYLVAFCWLPFFSEGHRQSTQSGRAGEGKQFLPHNPVKIYLLPWSGRRICVWHLSTGWCTSAVQAQKLIWMCTRCVARNGLCNWPIQVWLKCLIK